MPISQHQLAAAVLASDHIVDRRTIAAFLADAATQPAPNPFPNTSVGAVRQVWQQRVVEFQSFGIQVAGLACLLTSLSGMSVDEPLAQEILRAGQHTTNVFSHADSSRIVGAVLYGKPGFALPALPVPRSLHRTSSRRTRVPAGQLDLFADAGV
ncbi:hypothetical protein MCBMB27_00922 [Methylobacterium phyllosphaerae]|uniref:Uncharacterized protein n=2 Tax=Methylobacterium TaxID=407 RepID=A0AAE8HYE7_9HYPH|nr:MULTISPECIES: hypothetical protein [Methylobacterium]AGO88452.1 protein of unassigned function [Methylobacterium oryzae CBMB20]AIQ89341.1 protein of unassigned function [Methylobacterium oryzae CBMB20]APT30213.1 hypothetical protein MCBMB27_00922 [Methylobacterium phyllosphaerae]SFH76295.1 hypothetical protein SAMN05192567_15810 [Methylobacterium phyllosphaerae]